jgi:hypothetical protein
VALCLLLDQKANLERMIKDIQRHVSNQSDMLPACVEISLFESYEVVDTQSVSNVPLTSLLYKLPPDGLPLLPHWKSVASDVFWSGFQPLREPFGVTPVGGGATAT